MPPTPLSPDHSFLAAWRGTLARRGAAPAVFSEEGAVLRSFAGIEEEALEWEERLGALPPGAVLAIQMGARPEWPALVVACFRRGVVPLPLGRHMGEAERALALGVASASALVEPEGGALRLLPLEGEPPCWPGDAPHFLKVTSGTTAAPRAIRFRAEQLLEDALQICETMGIGEDDLNFAAIPLSHSYGFSNLVTPLLARGVPMALTDERLPRALLSGLAKTGATVFPGMPVFFDKFAALDDVPPLPRLRLCISAGAPLLPGVGERFTARFRLKVHAFYGSSECGGIAYDAEDGAVYREGYVGTPMSRVRLSARADGMLQVESRAVADGYWPPEPEGGPLGGGRFVPGDLARIDENGGVFLAGRVSEVINVAGRKLNPSEVEAQLLRCPGVREAVVFGVPSALRHEEPVACVTGSVAPAALLAFARKVLSAWQVPRDVWIVPELPRNERGKVSRRALAQAYRVVRDSSPPPP